MIESTDSITILADIQILRQQDINEQNKINQLAEEIQKKTEEINDMTISNNKIQSEIDTLTPSNESLIQETKKTNNNIHRLHKYVCDLRANVRITCRIANDNINSFLSFPELMYMQSNKGPIHSVNFIQSNTEFHFDEVYLPNRNQYEVIINAIKSDMLSSFNNKQNFTFFLIDDLKEVTQFIRRVYNILSKTIKENISLSVFYEQEEDIISQENKGLVKNENDLLNYMSNYGNKNNVIYQLKIEGKDNERYLTLISINSNFKHLMLIGKILFMLSNKKCNKNQIPFKESRFTLTLKNVLKPTDKVYFMNTIYDENSIDYLKQLLSVNLIY